MSNTNNSKRNVYNSAVRTDEMAMLLNQSQAHGSEDTTINIGSDVGPSTSHQQSQHQHPLHLNARRESAAATRINMEGNNSIANSGGGGVVEGTPGNVDDRQRIRNIFSVFREARHQLNRQQSARDHSQAGAAGSSSVVNSEALATSSSSRTWRDNLYDVIAAPGTPRSEVLRAIFSPSTSGIIRYNSLPSNDNPIPEEHFHFLLNQNSTEHGLQVRNLQADIAGVETQSTSTPALRLSRQSSRLEERSLPDNSPATPTSPNGGVSERSETPGSRRQSNGNGGGGSSNNGHLPTGPPQRQTSNAGSTAPTIEMDDADTTAMGELIAKIVSHFVRYLPFICILLVKFVHDHLLGILDMIVLTAVMYNVNKTLTEQAAKLNQKSYIILLRECVVIIFIVVYRFILASSTPDPFGLLINPPGEKLSIDFSFSPLTSLKTDAADEETLDPLSFFKTTPSSNHVHDVPSSDPTASTLHSSSTSATKTVSLGVLLYYVAVNDLVLKLLTQLVKIFITMLPTKAIRNKSRGRLYALVEHISQFYRALAPMRQWLTFLFESYSGLEIISGILFSSFYLGAKCFEFVERGKSLKKAVVNFVRNMDYDRKPTKDELDAAGTVCPICHDAYTTPVILECGHIFCDECVNTWFKREQTCPMCRAKVSEDPTWQDGSTTFFYQLF